MTEVLIRVAIIVMLLGLLIAGWSVHHSYRRNVPAVLWRLGFAYGYILVIIVVATMVNLLTVEHLTTGARVFAVLLIPSFAYVAAVTVRLMKHTTVEQQLVRDAVLDNPDEVARIFVHVAHLEPCDNPECQAIRARMRAVLPAA